MIYIISDVPFRGPVWVYVLERHRAVDAWKSIMGDANPEVARVNAPDSLRALYGLSTTQNAIMGSKDGETAEIQIASLFASSPPFPVSDLPPENGHHSFNMDTMRSVTSSLLSSLAMDVTDAEQVSTPTNGTTKVSSTAEHRRTSSSFKARPVPATTAAPTIKPRMSRAAALRTGLIKVDDDKPKSAPRAPVTKERLAQTFADVPGHGFRTKKIQVASTAPPAVAPRMTKAASLRLGLTPEQRGLPRPRASTNPTDGASTASGETKGIFDGVPGHKRRESISVASTKAPAVAPRLNKAASLRGQKSEGGPPSSFSSRSTHSLSCIVADIIIVGRSAAPSMSRSSSRQSLTGTQPQPKPVLSRSSSVTSVRRPPPSSFNHRGTNSVANALAVPAIARSASNQSLASQTPSERSPTDAVQAMPKPRAPRPSSISAPTVVPRQNKAAMLRAAKMAAQTQPPAVDRRKPLSTF
jgi:hypothetical protein